MFEKDVQTPNKTAAFEKEGQVHPYAFARVTLAAPASALKEHVAIQQHVSALGQLAHDIQEKHAQVAIKKSHLKRAFGDDIPKQFYTFDKGHISIVVMRSDIAFEDEVFGLLIALDEDVVSKILNEKNPTWKDAYRNFGGRYPFGPQLPITIMDTNVNVSRLPHILSRIEMLTYEQFQATKVLSKFHPTTVTDEGGEWLLNDEPEEQKKVTIHLKDIPLDNRNDRRLLRDALKTNHEVLFGLYEKHLAENQVGHDITYDQWLVAAQAVNVPVLNELQKLDELPDLEYVKAMVKFKQAQASQLFEVEFNAGRTKDLMQDWVLKTFNEPFEELGKDAAWRDIHGEAHPKAAPDGTEEDAGGDEGELRVAVFVVSFEGTIVEYDEVKVEEGKVGIASPAAVETLQRLSANGSMIIVLTDRAGGSPEHDNLLAFFEENQVEIVGTCESIPANDFVNETTGGLWVTAFGKAIGLSSEDGIDFDYVIDHRQFGIPTVQISENPHTTPTFFWADTTAKLSTLWYLTDEDVQFISNSMSEG